MQDYTSAITERYRKWLVQAVNLDIPAAPSYNEIRLIHSRVVTSHFLPLGCTSDENAENFLWEIRVGAAMDELYARCRPGHQHVLKDMDLLEPYPTAESSIHALSLHNLNNSSHMETNKEHISILFEALEILTRQQSSPPCKRNCVDVPRKESPSLLEDHVIALEKEQEDIITSTPENAQKNGIHERRSPRRSQMILSLPPSLPTPPGYIKENPLAIGLANDTYQSRFLSQRRDDSNLEEAMEFYPQYQSTSSKVMAATADVKKEQLMLTAPAKRRRGSGKIKIDPEVKQLEGTVRSVDSHGLFSQRGTTKRKKLTMKTGVLSHENGELLPLHKSESGEVDSSGMRIQDIPSTTKPKLSVTLEDTLKGYKNPPVLAVTSEPKEYWETEPNKGVKDVLRTLSELRKENNQVSINMNEDMNGSSVQSALQGFSWFDAGKTRTSQHSVISRSIRASTSEETSDLRKFQPSQNAQDDRSPEIDIAGVEQMQQEEAKEDITVQTLRPLGRATVDIDLSFVLVEPEMVPSLRLSVKSQKLKLTESESAILKFLSSAVPSANLRSKLQ